MGIYILINLLEVLPVNPRLQTNVGLNCWPSVAGYADHPAIDGSTLYFAQAQTLTQIVTNWAFKF